MEKLYDMITAKAAKILRIANYGLRVGCDANLVVLRAKDVYEALAYQDPPTSVISHGKLVVENKLETMYYC
jgi:cytosine deaminase